jgi:uncharacterized membrane protein
MRANVVPSPLSHGLYVSQKPAENTKILTGDMACGDGQGCLPSLFPSGQFKFHERARHKFEPLSKVRHRQSHVEILFDHSF